MHIHSLFARSMPAACLLVLTVLITLVTGHSTQRGPIGTLFTVQNATIHTHNHRVYAHSHFDLSFVLYNSYHVKFSLEPNQDIMPSSGAFVTYLDADGKITHQEPMIRADHKIYKGVAWTRIDDKPWERRGHARITVRRDGKDPVFQGVFDVDHDAHHIKTAANYVQTRHEFDPEVDSLSPDTMVLWRNTDIMNPGDFSLTERSLDLVSQHDLGCQSDLLNYNMRLDHPVYGAMSPRSDGSFFGSRPAKPLFKRQTDSQYMGGSSAGVQLSSTIGQSAGCPKSRKVALVGVATDCTYTAQFGSTDEVRSHVTDVLNQASGVWESTFNISLGLQNLTMSPENCPASPPSAAPWNQRCSDSVTINQRLSMFSKWRGDQNDANSHWTLLSTCNTGSAVGLAWLGNACIKEATPNGGDTSQWVSGANVVIRTGGTEEWQILAHETGHTFGAVHDCTSSACADESIVRNSQCCPRTANTCDAGAQFIMNPSTGASITEFSPCTIGNICSAMLRNSVHTNCLTDNAGMDLATPQVCGNGIVEKGEDCDCGGEAGCGDNSCCDAKTCKFKTGAVCDPSNDACCNSCQFAAKDTVCRESTGDCDPVEKCTGDSKSCPADVLAKDGASCGDQTDKRQCASGQCTSRNHQCSVQLGGYTGGQNITACDKNDCQLKCSDPSNANSGGAFGGSVCYQLQQNFLDGTPCKHGGMCYQGSCKGSSNSPLNWLSDQYEKNPTYFIVICVAVGLVVLILLFGIVRKVCGCCKGGGNKRSRKPGPSQAWTGQAVQISGPPPYARSNSWTAPVAMMPPPLARQPTMVQQPMSMQQQRPAQFLVAQPPTMRAHSDVGPGGAPAGGPMFQPRGVQYMSAPPGTLAMDPARRASLTGSVASGTPKYQSGNASLASTNSVAPQPAGQGKFSRTFSKLFGSKTAPRPMSIRPDAPPAATGHMFQ